MTNVIDVPEKAPYLADLDQAAVDGPAWVSDLREAAAARFQDLDFPNRRMEAWRHTNVAPIVRSAWTTATKPGAVSDVALAPHRYGVDGWTELVVVDGFCAAELSRMGALPESAYAGGLTAAIADDLPGVQAQLDQHTSREDLFSALNSAHLRDGVCIHVPKGAVIDQPIHVIHVATGAQADGVTHPRTLVLADESSDLTLIETYVSLTPGARYFTNAVTEIVVGANAHVKRFKVLEESNAAYHLSSTRVHQGQDSGFKSHSFSFSGAIARNELAVAFGGEHGECSLNGLYLLDGDRLVDNATSVDHAQPHCSSWVGYKGIIDEKSQAVFSGKIMVRRDAQKTDSNQLNQNLLLADGATIDTKPILEIFADDVKCTHGATVGQHPPEVIFYFRSRGVDERKARAMLTCGFADDVVNGVDVEALRERLGANVFDKYNPV
jgi:Fe-S cluster assembly protein SufD